MSQNCLCCYSFYTCFLDVPFLSLFSLVLGTLQAQFQFSGQVGESYSNQSVYLSLVEDYRKTERVYQNQLLEHTVADSLGNFTFSGDNLPNKNRIYRVHVDGCNDSIVSGNHFLKACNSTESILFIASNSDTIHLPFTFNQTFCEVDATNSSADKILEFYALKDEMILDFANADSDLAKNLKFAKWFETFQEFGLNSNEPLVELVVYDFLSNRSSETHDFYLEDILDSKYYIDLLERLNRKYPEAAFTKQFEAEITADTYIQSSSKNTTKDPNFWFKWFAYTLPIVVFLVGFLIYKSKRVNTKKYNLTQQEERVVKAMLEGKSNKEIAAEFFISLSTVKTHINNIYKKLNITSRAEIHSKF